MKQLRVLPLPPGCDASPLQGYPPAVCRPEPIHTPGWRETMWGKVSCLRKQHDGRDWRRTTDLQIWSPTHEPLHHRGPSSPKLCACFRFYLWLSQFPLAITIRARYCTPCFYFSTYKKPGSRLYTVIKLLSMKMLPGSRARWGEYMMRDRIYEVLSNTRPSRNFFPTAKCVFSGCQSSVSMTIFRILARWFALADCHM